MIILIAAILACVILLLVIAAFGIHRPPDLMRRENRALAEIDRHSAENQLRVYLAKHEMDANARLVRKLFDTES